MVTLKRVGTPEVKMPEGLEILHCTAYKLVNKENLVSL